MKLSRPSWDEYFIGLLPALSARGTCDRGRSAALFTRDNDILAAGYVGSPPKQPHCDDIGHLWSSDGKHCIRTLHAEQNAVIRAARSGIALANTTVYCTMEPCYNCAMTFVGLGVIRVVAAHPYHAADNTRTLFKCAHITLETKGRDLLYDHAKATE